MANSRNYRTPTEDDDADVPYWNDLLAKDIALDVDRLEELSPEESTAPGISWTVLDSSGRRSWVEVSDDGGMTDHSVSLAAPALAPAVGELLPLPEEIGAGSGLSYVVVDGAGRKSEIQLDYNGRFTGPFPERIISEASDAAVEAVNPSAGLPVTLWGDSLTAAGSGYGDRLALELGVSVVIQAIGGQGSASIAARQGGQPATITFPSNTIPGTTAPVTVTTDVLVYSNSSGTGTTSGQVTVNGVLGTLTRDNVTLAVTFTRAVAGTAVWAPPTSLVIPVNAVSYRGNIAVIGSGRNSFKYITAEEIVRLIQQMVSYMSAGNKRYLILEIPPEDDEIPGTADRTALDACNALLAKTFPHAFVPIAQYLRGPALSDMGITPTSQDTTDIANSITPTSLRSDQLHLNATGNTAVARFISNTIKNKGWV